jgi:hypothetical protein
MTIFFAVGVQSLYASDFDETILQVDNPDYDVSYEPAERAPAATNDSASDKIEMLPPEGSKSTKSPKSNSATSPEIPLFVDEAKETAQALKEKELLKKYYEMEKKEKRAKGQNTKKKKSGFRARI